MTKMLAMFKRDPSTIGTFGVEVYEAKESDMWLSMSYGRDVIRIDPYWFEWNPSGEKGLEAYFAPFWDLLLKIPSARLHWGKHWPKPGTTYTSADGKVSRTIGADYCQKSFPKYKDWMRLRAKYDPKQIFVTDYWRELLGIPEPMFAGGGAGSGGTGDAAAAATAAAAAAVAAVAAAVPPPQTTVQVKHICSCM